MQEAVFAASGPFYLAEGQILESSLKLNHPEHQGRSPMSHNVSHIQKFRRQTAAYSLLSIKKTFVFVFCFVFDKPSCGTGWSPILYVVKDNLEPRDSYFHLLSARMPDMHYQTQIQTQGLVNTR